ncbi:MAG TPA: bifunctional DNA-formamidopyrimidine glycosylase/DNA-(apurinic or apyrimidinic site) lyase [Nevskiales bacterium]|nr:bifunctional DNA-formamidopyrimidine glycosylase/DNA-(apurinic or apyrimidinic site) lyase [Nevskiales bacterium]
MPELPEVETTRRGVEPHVLGRRVTAVRVHDRRLRWPVPAALARELPGRRIERVERRAKYLLFRSGDRSLLIHLGMSGRLRVLPDTQPPQMHDHLDILLDGGQLLRLHDPRRFGCALWLTGDPQQHKLLKALGPEPFSEVFSGDYLFRRARERRVPVKNFLMDGRVVVGVGNIYASEALFRAGIHPLRAAGRVTRPRYAALAAAVREVLEEAIRQGGTTLRDYVGVDGGTGYFQLRLSVYDRAGQPCPRCGASIRQRVIGQRSSYYCPRCQR